jgi:hypothetical protein
VHYGITTLGSTDVLRYLGRPVRLDGEVPKSFRGEVSSDLKWREEGMRIKHSGNGNSVKLYDKAFTAVGSVLRAETTIHHGGEFRVYRRKEGDSKGKKSWRVLRGGVADLHRRAEISQRATERYLDALAGVDEQTTLQELLDRLGQPKQWKGRRVRALDPLGADRALLETICRGEFMPTLFVIGICRNSSFLRQPRICERPVGARRGSVGNCGCSGPTELSARSPAHIATN